MDDNSIAYDACGIGVDKARRQQMELESLAVNNDGMTRIVTSCAARNDIILAAESIYNLAFPLVTPLGAKNNGCTHVFNNLVLNHAFLVEAWLVKLRLSRMYRFCDDGDVHNSASSASTAARASCAAADRLRSVQQVSTACRGQEEGWWGGCLGFAAVFIRSWQVCH